MAGPNVTTTIRLEGQDRASAKINAVRDALGGAGDAAKHAAEKTEAIAEKSGDLERGFRGFKDVIGQSLPGLQGITDAFGGIESLLKGFGPQFGALGIGIAAIGAGAMYLYNQQEESRKKILDARIKEIDKAKESLEIEAGIVGVTRENLGWKDQEYDLEAQIGIAKKHADDLLDAQKEKLEAIKEKDAGRERAADNLIGKLRDQLQIDSSLVENARRHTEQLERQARAVAAVAREQTEEDARIAGMMNARARVTAQQAVIQDRLTAAANEEAAAKAAIKGASLGTKEQEERITDAVKTRIGLETQQRAAFAEAEGLLRERQSREKAAHDAAVAKRKQRAADAFAFEDELEKGRAEIAQRATETANAAFLAEQQRMAAAIDSADKLRAAQIALTDDPAERARLQMIEIEIAETRQLDQVRADVALNEEDRTARLSQIWAESNAKRKAILDSEAQREDDIASQRIGTAFSAAKSITAALEQEGVEQRKMAGLKAAIAAAEAGLAIVKHDYAGAVAAGIAAVQFGAIALGAGGSAGQGASAASVASAGMSSATAAISQGGGSAGGGGNVVINYTKGFYGSPQENAKGIANTLKSLKSTGFSGFKGA